MEFSDVYNHERVTRRFTNRKVSPKLIEKIIRRAQESPSLLNSQPWHTYVVMGQPLKALRKDSKARNLADEDAHEDFKDLLSLDWAAFPTQNMAIMGAAQTYFFNNKLDLFTEANQDMFNAPAIIYLTLSKPSSAWSIFDLGIFAQSIMLLAIDEGLAIMPAHSMVSYPDLVRKYAEIPEDELVGMAIAVGYKDKSSEVNDPKFFPPRLPFEKICKVVDK